jgi:ribosomal protein S18 acetylase RimI-like enzyme
MDKKGINMFEIRAATPSDIEFLTIADLKAGAEEEGEVTPAEMKGENAFRKHLAKIDEFVTDKEKGAWVGVTREGGQRAGMILCRFRNRLTEPFDDGTIFNELDVSIFPDEGRFCEIFQLWVEPAHRRKGLAMQLKEHLETEVSKRGIEMIYTHTRESNLHVLELNRRLGYTEIRRGPIWDDVIRVSLIKHIQAQRSITK